jgi:hypothetical protein
MHLLDLIAAAEPDNTIEFFDKLGPKFFIRLLINVLTIIALIRFVYFPIYKKKDFFFTFFLFNIVIFILTYLLNKVDLSMGAAFGLFAVFSLLRYRTENISAKDMTYLFTVIAIGLITSVNKGTYFETCMINTIIFLFAYFLDGNLLVKNEKSQLVQYEKIDLIQPQREAELIADLKLRTGLDVHKVSINYIDFLKDTAELTVYYFDK